MIDSMEELKNSTGMLKAIQDNYHQQKEAREHRKNTIRLEEPPEEKAQAEDFRRWAKTQLWNFEEQDVTNK